MSALTHLNGFHGAPASKFALGWTTASFLALNFPLRKFRYMLQCDYASVFLKKEIWRVPLSGIAFLDTKDFLLGFVLIYQLKKFEKRYGTRKFVGRLIGVSLLGQILTLGALYVIGDRLQAFPTGPISLVFSLFVPFYCDIPRVTRASLLGVPISGKSLAYISGLQIAVSSLESFILATIGIVCGILYKLNFIYIKQWAIVPRRLGNFANKLLGGILRSSSPVMPAEYGATLEIQRAQSMDQVDEALNWTEFIAQNQQNELQRNLLYQQRNRETISSQAPAQPPSEEQINSLMEMGFPRDRVLDALRQTDNDLTRATNRLLGL